MSAGAFRCGHDRAPANVYTDSNGTARCRACRDRRRNEWSKTDSRKYAPTEQSAAELALSMAAASRRFIERLWSSHPHIMRAHMAAGRQVAKP